MATHHELHRGVCSVNDRCPLNHESVPNPAPIPKRAASFWTRFSAAAYFRLMAYAIYVFAGVAGGVFTIAFGGCHLVRSLWSRRVDGGGRGEIAIPRRTPMSSVDGPEGWKASGGGGAWRDLPWYAKLAVIAAVLGGAGIIALIVRLD